MKFQEMKDILRKHWLWLIDDPNGERANLKNVDLRDANLQGADLRDANLRGANLQGANLQNANLQNVALRDANLRDANLWGANLRGANMSNVQGLIDSSEFLNTFKSSDGYIVYKCFGSNFAPNPNWGIKPGAIITEVVNQTPTDECGCGINVADLDTISISFKNGAIWKCLIRWEWACSIVVPYNTDGKFRCGKLELLEIVEE